MHPRNCANGRLRHSYGSAVDHVLAVLCVSLARGVLLGDKSQLRIHEKSANIDMLRSVIMITVVYLLFLVFTFAGGRGFPGE